MFFAIGFLLFCFVILSFFSIPDERPIFGIYNRKSKWFPFKYAFFICVFYTVKCAWWLLSIGKREEEKPKNLDQPLKLVDDVKAFDGVLFTGGNSEGYYFVLAAEKCHKRVVNGYFYLLVPKKGLLCSPKLPDTILFDGENESFGADGISISPILYKKKWKLSYRGVMWVYPEESRRIRVKFTAQWTSSYDCFNCLEDIHPFTLAKTIATEAWSSQFFHNMRFCRHLDVQYYQMGSATVELACGSESHNFSSLSFRSRQHGTKRGLIMFHRSATFQVFLDNGIMAVISMVSQPSMISTELIGYVQQPDGSISQIDWCDFQLYQNGECGRPPTDHGFQFRAGGIVYTIQMKVLYEYVHFIGWNWEAKVFERFVKCMVNGVLGQGVSEFTYKNKSGRPAEINDKDPPWFQVYRPHYIYS